MAAGHLYSFTADVLVEPQPYGELVRRNGRQDHLFLVRCDEARLELCRCGGVVWFNVVWCGVVKYDVI